MTIEEDGESLDIFADGKEITVKSSDVEELQHFENQKDLSDENILVQVERLKAEAKVLFMKQDFEAAIEWYQNILNFFQVIFHGKVLRSESVEINPTVVIKHSNHLHLAVVEGVKAGGKKVLISLLEDQTPNLGSDDENDDMIVIDTKDIIITMPPVEQRPFLTAILLNLARCYLSLKIPAQSIWRSTCALRVASFEPQSTEVGWSTSTLTTAYFLRAKAHNQSPSPSSLMKALRDCRRSDEILPGQKEVLKFIKVLEKREAAILKADRKLARQIGAWTEAALEKQAMTEVHHK
eukprot:CAMPEP_0114396626 /NCGR_PEP_ID=MMETSP0102-20121206/13707_1 /TAXON_ID=38822 ORGANISM="Pteridomonas danica, Strain PT" /NCGR_SAMPLE_ID=MMETSP0102 /ASSEMBLY_ACC=CAM_ASM_000212 /LENGTH=293 /DNA_ID=CAMNT_0001557435 /DNA_START=138 /DNA_END=1020 /DNA_ORIENTATION=-